jgi:fatty-acyl-CoA synthase
LPWAQCRQATLPDVERRRQPPEDVREASLERMTTERSSLWPTYEGPEDVAAIEELPLAERGLPASTYELVIRAAALWPDRPAMSVLPDASHWNEPVEITYASLADRVHAYANALEGCGIGRRDAVAILSPNCAAMPVALLAAEAVGVAAPINPNFSAEHIGQLLELSGTRVLIAAGPALDPAVWKKARQVVEASSRVNALLALGPTGGAEQESLEPLESIVVSSLAELADRHRGDVLTTAPPAHIDVASYFHTGGTTGAPKLAAHTHENEVSDAWMIAAGAVPGDGAVLFGALPLFHVNALVVTTLSPLFKGQHVVWAGPLGYRDPNLGGVFWKIIERYRVGAMSAVPTVYGMLAHVPIDADISSLELAIVGAAPLPEAVREAFESHTGVPLCEGYGLTEATCASARSFPKHRRNGSVGQRMPYQQIKSVRRDPETGRRSDLAPDEVGELMISGPTVFPGYVVSGQSDRTLDPGGTVIDGWLDTGDRGSVDEDGFVRLAGRTKDVIIRAGHNIDPAVIEDALLTHPAVAAASAVGGPDPHAGEVPVAFVSLAAGYSVDPGELAEWAASRVPERAAAPRQVFVSASLPLTDVGKPFKPDLRREATRLAIVSALSELDADIADQVRSNLVDGRIVIEVPTDISDDMARLLDAYPVTWARTGLAGIADEAPHGGRPR